ncbi:MAG: hypothetical protein Q7T73_03450 [Beijerinckiaceae bacterium]|nr:hypothetical protein [Beijerinckiaceae bacterium]
MSRKRSSRALSIHDDSADTKLERLLNDVRAEVGFIISAEAAEAVKANPPRDPEALTDAIVTAAGSDPVYIDEAVRRSVRRLVDARIG